VEAEFRHQKGVLATAVGYAGGHTADPTYERVCEGGTGHAESVIVEFDPAVVTYRQLVDRYLALRDPTHKHNPGYQYRSAIFYHSPEQRQQAEEAIATLNRSGKYSSPASVEVAPAGPFYRAEEYHQQYEEKGGYGACRIR
jgi:peptide-methionine (S)-S-oxide reductase